MGEVIRPPSGATRHLPPQTGEGKNLFLPPSAGEGATKGRKRDARMLPVFRPLQDRAVLIVWSGLCTSTIGEDLFRVASVWLAVEVAGNMVGLVTGVQYVTMLVAGLFGGVLFDRWRPVQAMLVSRWWSAAFACCRWSATTSPASRSPC